MSNASNTPDGRPLRRLVVVPKPLSLLPTVPDVVGDDPESRAIATRLELARREHAESIARIGELLGGSRLEVSWVQAPRREDFAGADLALTIGGDGTFLTVARLLTDVPLFGINSSPTTSTGHYCAATADNTEGRLADVLAGRVEATALTRIAVEIDGRLAGAPALNDALFAHRTPVASTRYALRVGESSELQLSSGVWISTSSGSSAAIRSAGGEIMAREDTRLQYRVREPYQFERAPLALRGGYVDALEIVSRSDKNALFLDGHAEPIAVPFGARARLSVDPARLRAFLAFRWGGLV